MSEVKEVTEVTSIKLKENRVLIKKFEKEEKSKGGIILPDDQQEAPEGGTVVAVGPGRMENNILVENACRAGEKVRYVKHGMEVEIDGEEYYLLRDSDVWGTIE